MSEFGAFSVRDRSDVIFLVAALALTAGVPVALYAIYYFAESIQIVATALLLIIVFVSAIGIIVARYKDQIIAYLLKAPARFARDISEPLSDSVSEYLEGDTAKGRDRLEAFCRSVVAHYTWVQTRRWILGAAAGLLLGFAGLVGSALLKQQNDLILRQNTFFREQIEQQQQQLELQQQVANQTIRSEAIRRIYGPDYADTPRVKAEAIRSLVAVERVRIAQGENTLPTDFINLHDADLASAWLENADLRRTSFRSSTLNQANFSNADLTEAVFRFTRLPGAAFINAIANDSHFMFCDAQGGVFSNATLVGANFNQTSLKGALLDDTDVSGATFFKVNLENADLRGLRNWKAISSIEGSNIFGVRNAPEGFEAWALAQGAIQETGALSDLWERGEKMKRVEETAFEAAD